MAISEFERRAWETRKSTEKIKPELALKVALDEIETGAKKYRHVIITLVEDCGDGDMIAIYQAGDMSSLAVEGALHRAVSLSSSE